jgi:hypothetical protein
MLMIDDVCAVDGNTEEVVIVAFGSIYHGRTGFLYDGMEPGLYLNDSWPIVRKSNGTLVSINSCHLNLKDKNLESERRKEKKFSKKIKIQDLPETPFYEMDVVKIKQTGEIVTISGIEYQYLNTFCNDNVTPYPCYRLNLNCGATTNRNADAIELIKRGNVWNEFHGLPLVFNSLSEEAEYAKQRGKYVEVKNPKLDLYSWREKNDVIEAIQNNLVHGIVSSNGFLAIGHSINAIKFHDQDLGNRVAKATLDMFKDWPSKL